MHTIRLTLFCLCCLLTPGASAVPADQLLRQLLDDYVEESLQDSPLWATLLGYNEYNNRFQPPVGEAQAQRDLQRETDYLQRLLDIPIEQLDESAQLSWRSFELDRRNTIAGFAFPGYLLPLDQMNGWQVSFPGYAAAGSVQPFDNADDYRAFLQRANGFALWMDSAVAAMEQGIARGYVLPRHIVQMILPQLRSQIVEQAELSPFYSAIKAMPETIDKDQAEQFASAYRTLVIDTIVPAYRRMLDFMAGPYLAASQETVGYAAMPNGAAWYQWEVNRSTTLKLSAEEVHQIGLSEVARIRTAMGEVMQKVGFEGDLQAFFTHLRSTDEFYFSSDKELLESYQETLADIKTRLPRLFNIFPQAPLEVKTVEPWRAASAAGASYQSASPDGSRAGVFYINTYNLRAQPRFGAQTLSLHEALPGHYFQGTLQLENTDLSRYQRYNSYTVYSEGWALYAESLGHELGLFSDPYDWYGRLNDEQLRAMRLVVDTGLHALGWSRQRAVDYMLANSSLARTDVEAEVDRYIVWPGQALAYKVGDLHLQALRQRAESALGERFDIREFHRQLLIHGALPLPVLEASVERWINRQAQ